MSYDIYLKDPTTWDVLDMELATAELPFAAPRGGTFAVESNRAEFNIPYSYRKILRSLFGDEGIRFLYGKTAQETIPLLEAGIAKLGDDTDPDHWAATEGNVKVALRSLSTMAIALPHGVWAGD
jgi:hypothetical protein